MTDDTDTGWASSCSECRYWNPIDPAMRVRGECRRQLAPMIGGNPEIRDWSVTFYNDFCGEGRIGEKPSAAPSCAECRLFRPLHPQRAGRALGVCQRWLPQATRRKLIPGQRVPGLTPEEQESGAYKAAEWPRVTANLWCGDGVLLNTIPKSA